MDDELPPPFDKYRVVVRPSWLEHATADSLEFYTRMRAAALDLNLHRSLQVWDQMSYIASQN